MKKDEIKNRIELAIDNYYNIVDDCNEIEKASAYNRCFFELEFLKEKAQEIGCETELDFKF